MIALDDVLSSPTGLMSPSEWDELAQDDFINGGKWLQYCSSEALYSGAISTRKNHSHGAIPVTVVDNPPNALYHWNRILFDRGLPLTEPRGIHVGPARGYQGKFLLNDPGLLPELIEAGRSLCDESVPRKLGYKSPSSFMGMYLGDHETRLLTDYGIGSEPLLIGLDAYIPISGSNLEEFAHTLPKKRKATVLRENRAFKEAGYEIRSSFLGDHLSLVAELNVAMQSRHGIADDLKHTYDLFDRQSSIFGTEARIELLIRDGRAVGFMLWYIAGDTLHVRAVGFRDESLVGASEYFNLTYYRAIELAQQNALKWVHAGIEASRVKVLRGAELRGLWLVDLSSSSPLSGSTEHIRSANRYFIEKTRTSAPEVPRAMIGRAAGILSTAELQS